ncbi:Protein real-time [Eumeta japonica]|uniref:Protein real-time n=1 Tax=Eumeta variegata TaxID=151549 RepID=A0A4C1X9H5_EUMVA|nr:Protein real-time [Eumeta japonica]
MLTARPSKRFESEFMRTKSVRVAHHSQPRTPTVNRVTLTLQRHCASCGKAYEKRFPSCPQIPVVVECTITEDSWSADDSQRQTTRRCKLNVEAPYLLKKVSDSARMRGESSNGKKYVKYDILSGFYYPTAKMYGPSYKFFRFYLKVQHVVIATSRTSG